jgi:protoheme IX farnesyltransferase
MEKPMISEQVTTAATPKAETSLWQQLVVLFKLRIVVLLLFAAIGGAFLAAGGWPGWSTLALVVLAGGLSAAAASALNEYMERDRDALMNRTKKRPLVAGAFKSIGWVPWTGVAMILCPVLATLFFNPALSAALAAGAFVYIVIYTLWLKPRTVLNIVIGGLAGSFAVLSGSAASGRWDEPAALALAALVFLWTPIHFWALALVYREDYARAAVPMLPVRSAPRTAAIWGLVHGIGAGLAAIVLAWLHPDLGPVYFLPALAASAALIIEGSQLVREPSKRVAWHLFHTSNLFLFIILLAICIDGVLRIPWPL